MSMPWLQSSIPISIGTGERGKGAVSYRLSACACDAIDTDRFARNCTSRSDQN